MSYKTGQEPQVNDEVMGQIEGAPARGRVIAVRDTGYVLVTRRAPYSGPTKPLTSIHTEVKAEELALVYRPLRPEAGQPTPSPKSAPRKAAAKVADKKEAAAK